VTDREELNRLRRKAQVQAQRDYWRVWYKQEEERLNRKYRSASHYVLASIIPFTESNLKLAFKPSAFFADLNKLSAGKSRQQFQLKTIKSAYYRTIRQGLVHLENDGLPRLTAKGRRRLALYQPKILGKNARLLLVFDVPERLRYKRDKLRTILKEFRFQQIQKSVWESRYDSRQYLQEVIKEERLEEYIVVYESVALNL